MVVLVLVDHLHHFVDEVTIVGLLEDSTLFDNR